MVVGRHVVHRQVRQISTTVIVRAVSLLHGDQCAGLVRRRPRSPGRWAAGFRRSCTRSAVSSLGWAADPSSTREPGPRRCRPAARWRLRETDRAMTMVRLRCRRRLRCPKPLTLMTNMVAATAAPDPQRRQRTGSRRPLPFLDHQPRLERSVRSSAAHAPVVSAVTAA